MNRILLALWAIIAMSIVAIITLAVVWNTEREKSSRLGLSELLARQLEQYNRDISRIFEDYELKLRRAMESFDPSSRAAIARLESDPLVSHLVVVEDKGAKGAVLYPRLDQIAVDDRSLITDAILWLRDSNLTQRDRATNSLQRQSTPQTLVSERSQLPSSASESSQSPWTTWYHQRGLILGYWSVSGQNSITMAIVPRGRWLADVVSSLPDKRDSRQDALLQLTDFEGNVITQWGNLELAAERADKDAELAVVPPLEGWRLRMMMSDSARDKALGLPNRWASMAGALGCSLALISLGMMVTLNLNRQLRLAQQQVSFVNQVSHELRTPLTNIRMYADLVMHGLQGQIQDNPELSNEVQRINVIQHESGRLGRLIDNVLCLARLGKKTEDLRIQGIDDLEQLITNILQPFLPQLTERGILLERIDRVETSIRLDRTSFEQILVNLVGNAIKYAADGKLLRIETALSNCDLHVVVIDNGPGIPKRMQSRIFQPFVRIGNRLEDPTGTGIGLSIARSLARQHGGDITLESSPGGCRFHVRLHVTPG